MRKLIAVENLSLDGVMEAPEQWAFAYQNAEIIADNQAGMNSSDALLLGRVTYAHFAGYWPTQTNDEAGVADYINHVAKFVVSSTMEKADWHNTTIIRDNAAAEIAKLKAQPGKQIVILGSGVLVPAFSRPGDPWAW